MSDDQIDQIFEDARTNADWLDASFEPSSGFIDTAVASTLQQLGTVPTTTPPKPARGLWIAGTGAAGVVLALVIGLSGREPARVGAATEATEVITAVAEPVEPSAPEATPEPAVHEPVTPEPDQPEAALEPSAPEPAAAESPSRGPKSLPSAAELFRAANQARSDEQFDLARGTYRELLARHPRSREAQMARISLGRLELDCFDQPDAALTLFDAYLAESSVQTLAGEALVGRARALGELGDSAGEAAAWNRLLAEHPDTPHTDRARLRLEQLGR